MPRLTHRAYEILKEETQKIAGEDLASQVQKDILMRRLEKLRSQSGELASAEELRDTVIDLFPTFGEKVLKKAAKANRPPGVGSKLTFAAIAGVGLAGGIYILNLPYPMIRWPVARVAPILLLPSYMSMDHNYRQAIALVEQTDQLINQATSAADFDLGETKVKQAQKHLDALPVWFLGYWPQRYCSFFQCSWQFTLDEFRAARAHVGRMEAKVFQEKNAQTLLNQGEGSVQAAKQQYQQATTPADQATAIAAWQTAMDTLQEISPQTLAGRTVQVKLAAFQRDYEQVSGRAAGSNRSNTLITVSKQFAMNAAQSAQNPPHPAAEWQEIIRLWEQAIARLQEVPLQDPGYVEAQTLLATYQKNLGAIRVRLAAEQESVTALERAEALTEQFLSSMPTSPTAGDRNRLISQLQAITHQLDKVKPGTTAHPKAQDLLQSAQKKLQQLQR